MEIEGARLQSESLRACLTQHRKSKGRITSPAKPQVHICVKSVRQYGPQEPEASPLLLTSGLPCSCLACAVHISTKRTRNRQKNVPHMTRISFLQTLHCVNTASLCRSCPSRPKQRCRRRACCGFETCILNSTLAADRFEDEFGKCFFELQDLNCL